MCNCQCHQDQPPRRRRSFLGMIAQIALLYVLLVFGGGTLMNTDHAVAQETGRLIHTVLLVEPSIHWADSSGHDALAGGLRVLSNGLDVGRYI